MSESENASVEPAPDANEDKKPAAKRTRKTAKKTAKKASRKQAAEKPVKDEAETTPELPLKHGASEEEAKSSQSKGPKRGTRDTRSNKTDSDQDEQKTSSDDKPAREEKPQSRDDNEGEGKRRNRNRRGGKNRDNNREKHSPPHVEIDESDVAKKAWKIFLGEVVEEGLALFDDRDARERAIKSFRLAEIFVTEQERRVARLKPKGKSDEKEEADSESE